MENFKNFELENAEMIFGGDIVNTTYTGGDGNNGSDMYDTDKDRIVYFE